MGLDEVSDDVADEELQARFENACDYNDSIYGTKNIGHGNKIIFKRTNR